MYVDLSSFLCEFPVGIAQPYNSSKSRRECCTGDEARLPTVTRQLRARGDRLFRLHFQPHELLVHSSDVGCTSNDFLPHVAPFVEVYGVLEACFQDNRVFVNISSILWISCL